MDSSVGEGIWENTVNYGEIFLCDHEESPLSAVPGRGTCLGDGTFLLAGRILTPSGLPLTSVL
jgi:hypothetical protein